MESSPWHTKIGSPCGTLSFRSYVVYAVLHLSLTVRERRASAFMDLRDLGLHVLRRKQPDTSDHAAIALVLRSVGS